MSNGTVGSPTSVLALVLLFVQSVVLAGCASPQEEVWRISSPDRRVDAVWVKVDGGATVDFSYNLFIVPFGGRPKNGTQVLVADRIKNLSVKWREPKRLEVIYDAARIFNFFNFWHDRDLDNYGYVVEIRLMPNNPAQLEEYSRAQR
jgi:hypothetical protein